MSKDLSYSRIAAQAGVSVMSVSNVLRTPDRVRPETKRKVEQAIRSLGGQLPGEATDSERPIITHRPHRRIRFLTSGIASLLRETAVYSRLFQAAIQTADEVDYEVSFSNLESATLLDQKIYSEGVDGLLLMGDWSALTKAPCVPAISLMSSKTSFCSHHIGYRRTGVGELAAELFIEKGYQSVAYVGPDDADRHEAFQNKLESADIKCRQFLVPAPYKIQEGQQTVDTEKIALAARDLMKTGRIQGVFLHSDEIGVAFRSGLFEYGRRSRAQPFLVGCNNDPPFTPLLGKGNATIDIGVQTIAKLAIHRIKEIAQDPLTPIQRTEVEPRLVLL